MAIYISPDGGETVYVQKKDGTRGKLVSQSKKAKDVEASYEEQDMIGEEAIQLRRKYPSLQKAWDRYKTIWHLVNED